MHAHDATTVALNEHAHVAPRLRRFDDSEIGAVAGNGERIRGCCRDLQEHAGIRPALIGLARRVQETRAEADAGRDTAGAAGPGPPLVARPPRPGSAPAGGRPRSPTTRPRRA